MAFSPAAGPVLSRRSLLAVSAGLALLAAGCTSDASGEDQVTAAQVDSLADQVAVQESLVAAYAAAAAADTRFGQEIAALAGQAATQLERLRDASPGSGSSPSASASSASPAAPSAGADPRTWLRQQVVAAADSHAAACLEQSGARAALLGSLAAGLRGHVVRLA